MGRDASDLMAARSDLILRCQFPASNLVELSVVLILSDRISGAGLMI